MPSPEQPQHSGLRQSVSLAAERIQEVLNTAERVAQEVRQDAEAEAEEYLAAKRREADELVAQQSRRFEQALAALRARLARIEEENAAMVRAVEEAIQREGGSEPPGASLAAVPPPSEPAPQPRTPALAPDAPARPDGTPADPAHGAESASPPGPAPPRRPVTEPSGPAAPSVAYPGTGSQQRSTPPPGPPGADRNAAAADVRESALIRATQMAIGGNDRETIEATLRQEFTLPDPGQIVDEILGPDG